MSHLEFETQNGEIFLAGERVPAGTYRMIEKKRAICLECEDILPASLDGQVACYERVDVSCPFAKCPRIAETVSAGAKSVLTSKGETECSAKF